MSGRPGDRPKRIERQSYDFAPFRVYLRDGGAVLCSTATQKFDGSVSRVLEGFEQDIDAGSQQRGRLLRVLGGHGDTPVYPGRPNQLKQGATRVFVAESDRLLWHG
ncbi:hypothetical protein [Allomesorhizobium alhagi]|uniref:Uncharacterized protein n=1 Tax=Mesorhizobium alhagi CCNWXJ12-2 TaxID=1107882 RepID=H0I2S5_9HYPH|nr:hypothetical protein [Mesorhizobium alhagi]EHK52699.1 hypothetical protein MAXJ12_33904 [Mesorhizobium alhagi CCNWXJ12-2]